MGSMILNGVLIHGDLTKNSRGGTELLAQRLIDYIPDGCFKNTQIHLSRKSEQIPGRKQILWCHDLAEDPAAKLALEANWDEIVFVSHWQREQYAKLHGGYFGTVLENRITPFSEMSSNPNDNTINLIYTSTPHRGLELLTPVFEKLASTRPNLRLTVYSSFDLYGWESKDAKYSDLFQRLKNHPQITYSKSISNYDLRAELLKQDIFVLPSIWKETSCLCLIEAMCAGLKCIHSSLGALPETSCGSTVMYDYYENSYTHTTELYVQLEQAVDSHTHTDFETVSFLNKRFDFSDINYLTKWIDVLTVNNN